MSDPTTLTARELSQGFAKKEFTSREVTQALLAKIEKQKNLNCFLQVTAESALAQADAADKRIAAGERGLLLGVPIAIKDVLATKGSRTTCGSKMLEKYESPYDATVVSRLKAAGAVSLGKTNMDEFAMGSSNENSAFGPVKNPWDNSRVPGGSSGGSSAAVAAALAPIALGSDTGGSIRQPAAFCNLVGIKPTYGRVSRLGLVAYASSLDQVGPMSRTVYDSAATLEVIAGHDPGDSTSKPEPAPKFTADLNRGVKGLKIGIPKEYFVKGLDPVIEKAVRDSIAILERSGASVVEVSLPHTAAAVSTYYIIAPAEASSNLARFDGIRYGHRASGTEGLMDLYRKTRSEGFGAEVKRRIMIGTYVLSSGYFDAFYLRAQKVRTLIRQDFTNAFRDKCDVIACPTTPSTAFKLGAKTEDPLSMYLEDIFTIPVNLAGVPAINIPCGFDGQGLPIGLQLIGKPWDEATLFATAQVHESATEWHKRLPR